MSSYKLQQEELKEKETQDINKESVDPNMDIDNQTVERNNIQMNISNTDCSYTELCSEKSVTSPGPLYVVFPAQEFIDDNNINSDDSSDDNTGSVSSSHKELMLRHKIRILQQQVRRKNKTIDFLKQLLADLKTQGKIEDDVMHLVFNEFGGVLFEIFKNQLLNCKKTSPKAYKYTDTIKQFALTLHFYSPKAYQYCRNIGLCLPNPSSLRNWTMSINAEPGFQRDVLSAFKQLTDEDCDGNLVFDSMAIRKQVMWDKQCQQYIGYCNYGNELHLEGSDTVVIEALVFMLVGINGKWKWSIGYFFIDKIKAVIQAEIIKTALTLAGDAGVRVCSITCDGAITNIRTLEILGCNIYANSFTDIKNYFIHPTQGYNVYVNIRSMPYAKACKKYFRRQKITKK